MADRSGAPDNDTTREGRDHTPGCVHLASSSARKEKCRLTAPAVASPRSLIASQAGAPWVTSRAATSASADQLHLSAWSDYSYDDGSDHHMSKTRQGTPVPAVVISVTARDGSGLLSAVITEP